MSLKKNLNVLEKKKQKCKTFSIPIKKEITNYMVNNLLKIYVKKKKIYDSARFMASSLSNLADNLTEKIHKINCKDCDCFL